MDKGCINLVEYFNSQGLKTRMSCERHWFPSKDTPNMSLFWISFMPEVTDEQIIQFKLEHNYPNGWFVKRLIGAGWLEWRYIAVHKEIANLDYELLIGINKNKIYTAI